LEYPLLLDEMMGMTFAFRVRWQKEWNQCSVLECKDSNVLVKRLQKEVFYIVNSTTNSLTTLHFYYFLKHNLLPITIYLAQN
jgi:hypothetical protein